jgi:glycine/D-amino acid oxidase-like deaminating enzyme
MTTAYSPKPGTTRRKLLAGALGLPALGMAGGLGWLERTDVGIGEGQPRARPVASSPKRPEAVDVVVVGGGILGTATALSLAELGLRVALCEKGVIAGEASSRAMGYIDSQMADPARFALMARNRQLWRQANARTGRDTGYREKGLITPLAGPADVDTARDWIASTQGHSELGGEILDRNAIARLFPAMQAPPAWALRTPQDGMVEPRLAAPALAEAARDRAVAILQHCAVRGVERSAGRLSAVVTEQGRIACRAMVLTGGYWTPLLLRSMGYAYDQFDIHLSMMELAAPGGPDLPLSDFGYGFRPQIDGRYSFGVVDFAAPILPKTLRNLGRLSPSIAAFWPIAHPGFSFERFGQALTEPASWPLDRPSPFEAMRVMAPDVRPGPLMAGMETLKQHFPAFAPARITDRWAGVISTTADNMPVISAVPGMEGVFVGSGFSYGLTYGLAAGEALAALVAGRAPVVDLSPYALGRFNDGSALRYHA